MKAVILAGGLGTRISEETVSKPKPMVKIGEMPIIWHIMKIYSTYGIDDFVICCGYKGEVIERFIENLNEKWNIECVDTGLTSMTGGRLKRIRKNIDDETFCLTYGDTLNNLNIKKLIEHHKQKGKIATVTACHPQEKYGIMKLENDMVINFEEKPPMTNVWVNGGFFVLEPDVFDYIKDDKTVWEKEPMEKLVRERQLSAFKHEDFYKPMDTISDRNYLNNLWKLNKAHWKVWT